MTASVTITPTDLRQSLAESKERQARLRRELIEALTIIAGGGDVTGLSSEAIEYAERVVFFILDQRYLEIPDPKHRALYLRAAMALLDVFEHEESTTS